jgi:hypothetical protein
MFGQLYLSQSQIELPGALRLYLGMMGCRRLDSIEDLDKNRAACRDGVRDGLRYSRPNFRWNCHWGATAGPGGSGFAGKAGP